MLKENKIHEFELKNGIRLIFQNTGKSEIVSCGILISAGTRDEEEGKDGLAHFIEHTIFKGTAKRKSIQIIDRLEMVGGELNAYTTKEETCIYATVMKQYTERALELLSDIVFNATFPENELKKEKQVVVDEILGYLDSPNELIFDDFESLLFKNHPLGNAILGTAETVNNLNRKDIFNFLQKNYFTDKMVISITGDLNFEDLKFLTEKYFSEHKKLLHNRERRKFKPHKPTHKVVEKETEQNHFVAGNTAYSYSHPQRYALVLLNNILGGPAMNSKLTLAIRERYGYAYHVESNYHAFSDTGIFNFYLATENKLMEKAIGLAYKELAKLRTIKFKPQRLNQYKEQLIGQIALGQENKTNIMIGLGRSLLNHNKIETLETIINKIKNITPEQIIDTAVIVFDENKLSSLKFTGTDRKTKTNK